MHLQEEVGEVGTNGGISKARKTYRRLKPSLSSAAPLTSLPVLVDSLGLGTCRY